VGRSVPEYVNLIRMTGMERAVAHPLMDRSFFAHEEVWIGAGTPSHMASLRPQELLRLTGAKTVELGGHG